MDLITDRQVREKYPALRIGIVIAEQVDNTVYTEELELACKQVFGTFASRYESAKDMDVEKNITAWREIYRSFGANPKKKTPTAEALLSRVIRSNFVPHISPAVDSYLMAETLHFLPIGGYDLTKLVGDITLRFSNGNEPFVGIGSEETENTDVGEIVYSDTSRILTRRWNYKDCDHCKIDQYTTRLALFVEGPIDTIRDIEIAQTTENIAANLERYCGAKTRTAFLDAHTNKLCISEFPHP